MRVHPPFRLKAPVDVILPPESEMPRRLIGCVLLRRVHAGDLRALENDAIYGRRCRPFSNTRIVRSREKVAVYQNLGLDMDETLGNAPPETRRRRRVARFRRARIVIVLFTAVARETRK